MYHPTADRDYFVPYSTFDITHAVRGDWVHERSSGVTDSNRFRGYAPRDCSLVRALPFVVSRLSITTPELRHVSTYGENVSSPLWSVGSSDVDLNLTFPRSTWQLFWVATR